MRALHSGEKVTSWPELRPLFPLRNAVRTRQWRPFCPVALWLCGTSARRSPQEWEAVRGYHIQHSQPTYIHERKHTRGDDRRILP